MSRGARLGAVGTLALLAALLLHGWGSGPLAAPPLGGWASLQEWYTAREAGIAVIASVRALALLASGWLGAACALQLLAAAVRSEVLRTLADAVSPRVLRTVTQGAVGLSVTAGLAVPVLPAATMGGEASGNPSGTAVMVPLDGPSTTTTSVAPPADAATLDPAPTTSLPPPAAPPAAPVAPPRTPEVVVAPGDSFWSIAAEQRRGGDVAAYWRALIEANRDRLVDPANPDLLYAGQVLVLP
jgi:hypothetical protein